MINSSVEYKSLKIRISLKFWKGEDNMGEIPEDDIESVIDELDLDE